MSAYLPTHKLVAIVPFLRVPECRCIYITVYSLSDFLFLSYVYDACVVLMQLGSAMRLMFA